MSNNQGSARDYVKSYVKESDTDDYLQQEQPRYDPTKPIQSPQTTPVEQDEKPTTSAQASDHFKVHLPTQNPIPSSDRNNDRESPSEQPQFAWTARDFKDQRNEIHETSLTVCADLHEDLMTCFQHGSWWDKAKMCEDQKQKFWSCYNAQKKFLKEVNYKGPISTPEQDDHILAEAYKLRDKLDKQPSKE